MRTTAIRARLVGRARQAGFVIGLATLVCCTACGTSAVEGDGALGVPEISGGTSSSSTSAATTPSPAASSTSEHPPIALDGDAAKNRACKLADAATIERLTMLTVTGAKGITNPGTKDYACAWFLASDIQASVTIDWQPQLAGVDAFVSYYRMLIKNKTVQRVPRLGDVAYLQNHTAEVFFGTSRLSIVLILHGEATAEDKVLNVRILRYFYDLVRKR